MSDPTLSEPVAPRAALSRRNLLRVSATAGLGAWLLAACGTSASPEGTDATTEPGGATATAAGPPPSPIDADQELLDAINAAGFGDAALDYTTINAGFEVLTGPGRRMQIGILDETGTPTLDREIEVAIVRSGDFEVVERIDKPRFYGDGLGQRGVYVFHVNIDTEAVYYLVTLVDGHASGTTMIARDPANSVILPIGADFPSITTPTVGNEMGLAHLCTREPDCTLHDVSLDDALATGKPVVLVVATPAYCQTAVCGPVVDVVENAMIAGENDDVTYIHAEVFTDAGNTVTDIINALGLPSEPWTFLVGSDGKLFDRFDGPVVPELLSESLAQLA